MASRSAPHPERAQLPSATPESVQNQILARIPAAELAQVLSQAEERWCALREELFEQNTEVDVVYFPSTTMVSLIVVLSDGTPIEAMTVGREGFVGSQLLNGVTTARYKGVCQIEGTAVVLKSKAFLSIMTAFPL
ncbi:MAG TPA: cyclic nucleotide-binding domain-containing protein [Gemmatimonadaceae bacterium]|nr:cyclic nucleotide-binding domain-containing protein [Gemmatimonadaceae bacterium]